LQGFTPIPLPCTLAFDSREGSKVMTAWRQVIELSISDEDVAKLMAIARSRTVPASWVERARIGYVHDPNL
jgi:hypothetical protein